MIEKQQKNLLTTPLLTRWVTWSIFLYSCLVFNFLEPFEISITNFVPVYHVALCFHGIIAAVTVFMLSTHLQPHLLSRINQASLMMISVWYLFLVFMVSVANWLYVLWIHHNISGWYGMQVPARDFSEVMPKFLAIYAIWGLICSSAILLFDAMIKQSQQNQFHHKEQKVTLYSENLSDNFRVKPQDIICFKTCDNYLELYYLNHHGHLKNRLIRSSMKRMQQQLENERFFRSHQSFLVNTTHILGLNKVKNHHLMEIAHLDFDVNIARDNVKHVKALLAH